EGKGGQADGRGAREADGRKKVLPGGQPGERGSQSPLLEVEVGGRDRRRDRHEENGEGEEERAEPEQALGHGERPPFKIGRGRWGGRSRREDVGVLSEGRAELGIVRQEFLDESFRVGGRLAGGGGGPEG